MELQVNRKSIVNKPAKGAKNLIRMQILTFRLTIRRNSHHTVGGKFLMKAEIR